MKITKTTREQIEERTIESAKYIIDNQATLKETAKKFGVSESTVSYDLKHRLKDIDTKLNKEMNKARKKNIAIGRKKSGELLTATNKTRSTEKKLNDHAEEILALKTWLATEMETNQRRELSMESYIDKINLKTIAISTGLAVAITLIGNLIII